MAKEKVKHRNNNTKQQVFVKKPVMRRLQQIKLELKLSKRFGMYFRVLNSLISLIVLVQIHLELEI